MTLSLTEQLILGILVEQPRHGYDIEQLIDQRGMRKWTNIGFSSIYYALEKLEAKELVVSAHQNGKEKKQYAATEKGVAVLKATAKKLLAERKPAHTHFMTGLATSGLMAKAEFTDSLQKRKAALASDLQTLRAKQAAPTVLPEPARRLLSLSEALLEAELHWVTNEIERYA